MQSYIKLLETQLVRGRGVSDLAPLAGWRGGKSQQGLWGHPKAQALLLLSTPKEKAGSPTTRKPLLSAFKSFVIKGSVFSALTSGEFRSLKQVG